MDMNSKKQKENKTEHLKIRISPSDKNRMKEKLLKSNYKGFGEMILDNVLNNKHEIITLDQNLQREYLQVITELKRIGTNFNQLNKSINSKKLNYFTQEDVKNISKSLKEINDFYSDNKNILNHDS